MRLAVAGNGKATKVQTRKGILAKRPDIKFKNTDESDAYGIGLTYFIKEGIIEWK